MKTLIAILLLIPAVAQAAFSPLQNNDINVKDQGAKGDGIADDYPIIQAAINQAGLEKRGVFVPNGQYKLNGTLLITNSIVFRGAGSGELEVDSGHSTVFLKKTNAIAIKLCGKAISLRDFTVLGKAGAGDTTHGIMVGDAVLDATDSSLQNVCVRKCGGDGIWVASANIVQLNVSCFANQGHGLRLQSNHPSYDNVNACKVVVTATGNKLNGLDIETSSANVVEWAVCQGNYRYGWEVNYPVNQLHGYTEGNVIGSAHFGVSAYGCFVVAKFVDGPPVIDNGNLVMWYNTNTDFKFNILGNATFLSNGRTLFGPTTDDGVSTVQVGGPTLVKDKLTSWDIMTAPEFHLQSGNGYMEFTGAYVYDNTTTGNDSDATVFYGKVGTNDPVRGRMQIQIKLHSSSNPTNRFAEFAVGDDISRLPFHLGDVSLITLTVSSNVLADTLTVDTLTPNRLAKTDGGNIVTSLSVVPITQTETWTATGTNWTMTIVDGVISSLTHAP